MSGNHSLAATHDLIRFLVADIFKKIIAAHHHRRVRSLQGTRQIRR